MQEMVITSSNAGLLQMVQSVPCLQVAGQDKASPYSAVSTILLQGGILQLKSDPGQSGSSPGGAGQAGDQVVTIPLDSKGALAQELLKQGGGGEERMVPGQAQQVMVTSPTTAQNRAQDAIASILASMNQQNSTASDQGGAGSIVSLTGPVDYSAAGDQVVTMVEASGDVGGGSQPINLANIAGGQQIQVQGIKRVAQGSPGGSVVTKKVIIATINGTQRILTPVSSPQMIAVKSSNVQQPRIVSAEGNLSTGPGTPLTIIQQKSNLSLAGSLLQAQQQQQQQQLLQRPKLAVTSPTPAKSVDNKTCRWKFENGQICGKVFTKTYNLTVHMRMHQDIRPFPCTICEQTFRQKAHLQRHEATHGIDSTQGRKRRKKSLLEGLNEAGILGARRQGGRMSESEEEEGGDAGIYRPYHEKRPKFSVGTMKSEADLDLDPMIEPIDGSSVPRKHCPVTVGTNTEITPDVREDNFVDDLEEDMEPVRYKSSQQGATMQVEQGVQYCEADLLPQGGQFEPESKFVPGSSQNSIDAPQVAAMQTQVSMTEFMGDEGAQVEMREDEDAESGKVMKTEMVYTSQGTHYVSENHEYIEQEQDAATHLLTADGSFIDASSNHLVMSDGVLVSLVNCVSNDTTEQQENVVNIVTSTATNEQGQQIVIIENLDQHSPELQREIMNALLADHTIVPISIGHPR